MAPESFSLTSSGAVYGKQPADLTHSCPETFAGTPDPLDPMSVYAENIAWVRTSLRPVPENIVDRMQDRAMLGLFADRTFR